MADAVVIRGARPADLDALVALLGLLFSIEADFRPAPERQRRGLALALADPERAGLLVAERAGAVIGMVAAQLVVSTAEGAPSAWIEDLVVAAPERGRGVGRPARGDRGVGPARGAARLQLLANRENGPALAFYARLGWSTDPARVPAPGRGVDITGSAGVERPGALRSRAVPRPSVGGPPAHPARIVVNRTPRCREADRPPPRAPGRAGIGAGRAHRGAARSGTPLLRREVLTSRRVDRGDHRT